MLEHPSLGIAELSLDFWGNLGEFLADMARGGQGPRSVPLEESVKHACRVAMLRARYPPPSQGGPAGMDPDAKDELEDFREQVRASTLLVLLVCHWWLTSVGDCPGFAWLVGSPSQCLDS